MNTADWFGAVTAILLFILTCLVGVIGYLFKDLNASVKTNSRHIESLLANDSELLWRMTGAEDHLVDRDGYHPPRLIRQQWQKE